MAVRLKDFVRSLSDSGLISAEELRDFLGSLPPEKRPKLPQDLARELVRAGKITKYQAGEVFRGRTKGLVLGNYIILDKIGAGGMGQVYKARHKVMERVVALKVLPPQAVKSEHSVQRFHREVKAAAKLTHPNIVIAHDADQAGGIHFLVMEHVNGSDLSHIVSEHGPLAIDTAVDCIIQAARGLEYAHEQGVIHRDIKPANLLVDKKGTVKILDMGLARLFEGEEAQDADRLTDSGQVMGTCDYMAPEQAEDSHGADHRADIYSLGCTLYRIVTGKRPYTGESLIHILLAHREAPIPSMCEARPDVPASLEAVYEKMVAKSPDDRYQSMAEVIAALESCVAKERQPLVSEASSDSALTAFLQNLPEGGISTRHKAAKAAEETNAHQTKPETETNIWRKLVPADPRQRKLFAGVAAGAAFLVVLLGVVLSLRTPDGTLIVEIPEDDAVVQVLSEEGKVEIEQKGKKGKLSISVDPGKHRLKVEKDGFEFFTEGFEIESGAEIGVKATLEPLVAAKKAEKAAVASSGTNYALEFDGTDDHVHIPTLCPDASQPMTVEALVRPAEQHVGQVVLVSGVFGFRLMQFPASYEWQLRAVTDAFEGAVFRSSDRTVSLQEPASLAAVYDGERVQLYVNGLATNRQMQVRCGEEYDYLNDDDTVRLNRTSPEALSCIGAICRARIDFFHGIIDEVRISNITRYTEDFTPQRRFEPDEHTMALYHFDEGSGDVLKDSSGNGHHGKIVGAKWVKVDEGLGVTEEPPIAAVDVVELEPVQTLEAEMLITSVAFTPDGSLLVFSDAENVHLRDTATWNLQPKLNRAKGFVHYAACSPDGSLLAASVLVGKKPDIDLWDMATGERQRRLETGYTDAVHCLAFAPDGSVLASIGTTDGFISGHGYCSSNVELWDVTTGKLRQRLTTGSSVREVTFSPDGSTLACGASASPQLWDVATGKLQTVLKDPETGADGVTGIAFNPDGSMLATAHWIQSHVGVRGVGVRIWDVRSGAVQHRLHGHTRQVYRVAFTPDGSLLASASEDTTVRLWNPVTGEELATLRGHNGPIGCVAFSPDGRWLATGSHDNTVKIWDVSKFLQPKSTFPPLAIAPFTPEQAEKHQRAWADHLGVSVEFENSIGMKMVLIPPGEFMMGSSEEEIEEVLKEAEEKGWLEEKIAANIRSEVPQHKVRITRPFFLATHETTVGQFKAFVDDARYKTGLEQGAPGSCADGGYGYRRTDGKLEYRQSRDFYWNNLGVEQTDQHPVVNLTRFDPVAFCEWLSKKEGRKYGLPTEAQWEYACRAGSMTRWCFGDSEAELMQYAVYDGRLIALPVGRKLANAFGVFNLHGNVREWCFDRFSEDYYKSSPESDPEGSTDDLGFVIRGGSYFSHHSPELRSAARYGLPPDQPRPYIGFRITQTIPTGYLALNITEPNATVSFDNDQSTFTMPDDAQPIETVLPAGKHTVEVTKTGFKPFKKEISIEAEGRETLSVQLELVEAAAGAVDPDREVAQWLLSIRAQFQYWDKESITVRTLDDMPKGPFHIVHVYFPRVRIDDADLDRLAGLKQLSMVQLHYNREITDEGLKRLITIKTLDALYLGGTRITDDGLSYLKQLPKLRLLHLSDSSFTDAGIAHLRGMDRLERLMLANTKVTDSGLKYLKEVPHLTELNLTGTQVTPAGVAELQAALPNCKITWDGTDSPAEE